MAEARDAPALQPARGANPALSRRLVLALPAIMFGRHMPIPSGNAPGIADAPADQAALRDHIRICLTGDVMLGRGIDQILPYPGDPLLYERNVFSARTYLQLAEEANGPIPRPVDFSYVWGDALSELRRARPHLRIVNLETSVTTRKEHVPKGINYKMNPANIGCLSAFGIDCCGLANNHVLDWGREGLLETLETLKKAGIAHAGAGCNAAEAHAPAVLDAAGHGTVLVFAFGSVSSGIPREWAAERDQPGIDLLDDLSDRTVARIAGRVQTAGTRGDVRVASIHWGENWGYEVSDAQRHFARSLIDVAGFDLVHGHSTHHAKGIEIYRGKLILYGCGDFLNDYEGIRGYEAFRDDLAILYLATYSVTSRSLVDLCLTPFQIRRFRLNRISQPDIAWLQATLDRESAKFGARIVQRDENSLNATWQ